MKLDKLFPILIGILIAFNFSPAWSATYYIDYDGGNDSNSGTLKTNPWKRCPGMPGFSGSYSHSSGDQFIFKGGVTWKAPVDNVLTIPYSGGVDSPDQYAADKSWYNGPIWDYPVFDGNAAGGMTIYSNNKSNLVFDSLKIVNTGNPADGSGHGMAFGGAASNIEIKNCWLETNSVNGFVLTGTGTRFYFHDNVMKTCGRGHIYTGDKPYDDIRIYNNLFPGPETYDPKSFHTDGLMIGADGSSGYRITNLKIYNNKWYGDWRRGATAFIYLNGTPSYYSCQNVEIYNNQIVYENNFCIGTACISPAAIFVGFGQNNIKIYNNTIDLRAVSNPVVSSCISLSSYGGNVPVSNVDIRNNILAGCDNGVIIGIGTTGVTLDYNLYYTSGNNHLIWDVPQNGRCNSLAECQRSPYFYETHSPAPGDPQFAKLPSGGVTGSGDWRLQPNSPAKDHGVSLSSTFSTDVLGISRPQGSAWDIGAYEWATNLPNPPTNLRLIQ